MKPTSAEQTPGPDEATVEGAHAGEPTSGPAPAPEGAPGAAPVLADGTESSAQDVPRPIGPARLRALREAIRAGTYPRDEDVRQGLVRMFDASASPSAGPTGSGGAS